MIEFISVGCFAVITWYWIKTKDPNISKLNKIFERNNLKAGDFTPTFIKKRGDAYLYKMPIGLTFDEIKSKKQAFEDAFPDNEIDMSYDRVLKIVIADPLPEEITFDEEVKGWSIPLGKGIEKIIKHDFTKYPHVLIAGMTRYGKTVLLKLLICMIVISKPKQSELALIDLKGGLAFNRFKKLSQAKWMASNVDETLTALKELKKESDRRLVLFKKLEIEKLEEMKQPIPRIFIFVDEAAELSSQGRKGEEAKKFQECERQLEYVARIGAGLGIHLIYCTQYPTTRTLPQQVKQNCDATISFRLRNSTASRVVFDETDKAEKLPHIRGRAIYRTDKDTEIQVFYMSDEKINEIIESNRKEGETIEQKDVQGDKGGEDTFIIR